jgi:hypothetical protein
MATNCSSKTGQNHRGSRLLRLLARKKGTISASDPELEESAALLEEASIFGGALVFVGVAVEVALLIWPADNEKLAGILASIFVAIGVGVEVLFGKMASRRQGILLQRSRDRLAAATNRVAELTERVAPRALTKEQFNALQALKGAVSSVNLMMDSDPEVISFGMQILSALLKSEIKVGRLTTPDGWAHHGIQIWLPANEFDLGDNHPLVAAFKKSGIGCEVVGALAAVSFDVPRDVPMVWVGERRIPFETAPYLGGS